MTKQVGQLRVDDVETRLRLTREGRAYRNNVLPKMMADPRRMTYVGFQTDVAAWPGTFPERTIGARRRSGGDWTGSQGG